MGGRVNLVNDIQILREMLKPDALVTLQSGPGKPSVHLTDAQSGTTVKIKGLPHDSIVIRAENFEHPLAVFNDAKGQRKRADFVIISNEENAKKWIVCIETQKMDSKRASHVVQQLKGAACFISYCRCIGKLFWESNEFLDDYEYRFISVVRPNDPRKGGTQAFQDKGKLHNQPAVYRKISGRSTIYFGQLINPRV